MAARGDRPIVSPVMMTMNDFFYRLGGAVETDRIDLLLKLYENYCKLNPKAESLDDFIFWGDVLLADFDDVDKYLVNARILFTNVSDFKNVQDNFSYLSELQKEAIERFVGHFDKGEGKKDYKARFLQIWDILYRLYENFRKGLEESSMSYEGQVYRAVAERIVSTPVVDILKEKVPESEKFVFVGLNALNECEKKLMGKMRDAGLAEFCWDFSGEMIKDDANKSSFFLRQNVEMFPQAFRPDPEGLGMPEINVLSVPSGIGMAKQIPSILKNLPVGVPGLETAIVLPDEGLLLPVLNSIPDEIGDLNVTMGYPMGASEFWSLMNDVSSLQMHTRLKDGKWYFYHKQVWAIFSNSIFKSLLDDEGTAMVSSVRKGMMYYIPQENLEGHPLFDLIFRPAVMDATSQDADDIAGICEYQLRMTAGLGAMLKGVKGMTAELDFAKEYYNTVARLRRHRLPIRAASYFRLLSQLAGGISVPFQGEPLKGLQIMGPLETRALDFKNIIILSCNEGVFPRKSVSSSFIPPELRKGFGLPTYEFQDAVWAYYFYRMIQRADNVWMLFDSRADGLRGGEESRYIKQLELHFGMDVNRFVVKSPIAREEFPTEIPKTKEHLRRLHEKYLSASSLKNYLSCPAKFFYGSVEGLSEDEEVSESLDAGAIGNVFHKTMEKLYKGRKTITAEYLDSLTADRDKIRGIVSDLIKEVLHSFEIVGRNLIFLDVVCSYVEKVLKRDRELLDRYKVGEFRILGLEDKKTATIGGFRFKGYLDRLDSFRDDEIRIVDYKTGKVSDEDFIIDEDNAGSVVEKLFGNENSKRPQIALQLYLYDRFISESEDNEFKGKRIVNSIYQPSRLYVREIENVELNEKFCGLMEERIEGLLKEMDDLSVPWRRCNDDKTCEYCDFKMICGK
ncbi:MAG: PD-(D/E)XK nuclease family protein [Bacteroidales bacterium]|nr:PD-(D/E)XK nuclease family protein [Bacteroidales bacterium]